MTAFKVYVRWLRRARSRVFDDDTRVDHAFNAGYALLQDAAPHDTHADYIRLPNAAVIRAGARTLGVCTPDTKAGLRLLKWADWQRHVRTNCAPCGPEEAISWAERIRALYASRRQSGAKAKH